MNILISDSWLREHLKTKATAKEIAKSLSLCSQSVEKTTKTGDDWLYEIEITTNRSDCLSVYGIARELSVILPRFKIPAELQPLLPYNQLTAIKNGLPLNIKITDPTLCPRFTALIFDNIVVKSSPKIIQERLEKSGIRALNNVVDISNYLLLELGQPMHTFDYDKIKGAKMLLRESKTGEQVITLDSQKRQLPKGTIVIEDGDKRIVDLCGIMGGENSAVDKNTKRVLLFVQTYDPAKIRRTCQLLAFRTDAASRFEKGVDPEGVMAAMERAIPMFVENCEATTASKFIDIYPQPPKKKTVTFNQSKLNQVMGIEIGIKEAKEILESLGFRTTINSQQTLITTTVPHWRYGDVSIAEDLIEEIARLYGYHNLPNNLPASAIPQNVSSNNFQWQQKTKEALKFWGFTETYNYSMVSKQTLLSVNAELNDCVKIANPLTEEWVYMRPSLLPSLLMVIAKNQDLFEKIKIFELASIYTPIAKDKLPNETLKLAGLLNNENFYVAKGIVESLLSEFGILDYRIIPSDTQKASSGKIFHPSHQAQIINKNNVLGTVGQINSAVLNKFGVKGTAVGFDLNFKEMVNNATTLRAYHPIPKYPPVIEDLSFVVLSKTLTEEIIQSIKEVDTLIQKVVFVDYYKDSRTFRVYYQATERNLTNEEVSKVREKIIQTIEQKFLATLKA